MNKEEWPIWLQEQRQKESGLKVPDGYFDTFEDRVFEKIEQAGIRRQAPLTGRGKPAKRFGLYPYLMAAAAFMVLVLAAVWFLNPTAQTDTPTFAQVELSDDEIERYVLEHVHEFETDQLAVLKEEPEQVYEAPVSKPKRIEEANIEELTPADVENILNDMTDEELEEIL